MVRRMTGVERVLRILWHARDGMTAQGVHGALLAEGWYMAMESISPTLSQLAATGDVRKSDERHTCAHCGTRRPRYELTRQGKLRIEPLLVREEA